MGLERIKRALIPGGNVNLVLMAGGGLQSVLEPAAQQSRQISYLWWIFVSICGAIYLLVLVFGVLAIWRKRRDSNALPIVNPDLGGERRTTITVSTAVGLSVVILFFLLISDFVTGNAMHAQPDPDPLKIKVVGHQWWWEVQYLDAVPSRMVTTANEIHVPVGKPVEFDLSSTDVIHSFWAPNFHGKKDLVPGHPTKHWFRAERAGTFRGQCAEFCGLQHAHMRFVIVADERNAFDQWLEAQRKPAAAPADDQQKRGQEVFLHSTCIMCHNIQGTPARGRVGPDLTHVGSRTMLAAGTLPNQLGHLAGWIANPQQIKPGVRMPPNPLSPEDLRAVAAYLENLK